MWPWGHAAIGYIVYSLALRARGRRITGAEAIVIAVATQAPDLVDKPLAWAFDVFAAGYAVGHSAFVAVPVGVAVAALSRRRGRPRLGVAAVVGYWTHLAGDVLAAVVFSRPYTYERVLWPAVTLPASHISASFLGQVGYYWTHFLAYLATAESPVPLAVYVAPSVLAVGLWLVDGRPGLGCVRQTVAWVVRRATGGEPVR